MPQINIKSLDSLIKFQNIPSDLTIYKSIQKLKPANILEIDLSKEIGDKNQKYINGGLMKN